MAVLSKCKQEGRMLLEEFDRAKATLLALGPSILGGRTE